MTRIALSLPIALLLLAPRAAAAPRPVVVELFTSQGCSSCPAADHLLTLLGRDPAYAGQVIPLAFHVDYWNYIGWRDPFSQATWTARQRRYVDGFGERRIYTPQLVVNGEAHAVGSDQSAVFTLMDETAARGQRTTFRLAARESAGSIAVTLDASAPAGAPALDLYVAIAQNDLETKVSRGENQGRILRNDHIVRRLVRAGSARAGATTHLELDLEIDRLWGRGALEVVAFAQDPATMRVHGVAQVKP